MAHELYKKNKPHFSTSIPEEIKEKIKNADKSFFYVLGLVAKQNFKIIRLGEGYIVKEEVINGKDNSKFIKDNDLSDKVWEIIESRIEQIKKCSEDIQKSPRIVDGYNDSIIIKYNNKSYGFSSKTEDKTIQEIYKEISTEILKYLDI